MDDVTSFFIDKCKSQVVKGNQLILEAPNYLHALFLRRSWEDLMKFSEQKSADSKEKIDDVLIHWEGDGGKPYQIPLNYAKFYSNKTNTDKPKKSPILQLQNSNQITETSQIDLLHMAAEEEEKGKIVILTWHTRSCNPNRCFFTSDNLNATRAGSAEWTPSKFHNIDYLESWRAAEQSLEKFNRLTERLEAGEKVNGYVYRLRRKSDDALVEYSTDYRLFTNKQGEQIRMGISEVDAYEVISTAPRNR